MIDMSSYLREEPDGWADCCRSESTPAVTWAPEYVDLASVSRTFPSKGMCVCVCVCRVWWETVPQTSSVSVSVNTLLHCLPLIQSPHRQEGEAEPSIVCRRQTLIRITPPLITNDVTSTEICDEWHSYDKYVKISQRALFYLTLSHSSI